MGNKIPILFLAKIKKRRDFFVQTAILHYGDCFVLNEKANQNFIKTKISNEARLIKITRKHIFPKTLKDFLNIKKWLLGEKQYHYIFYGNINTKEL